MRPSELPSQPFQPMQHNTALVNYITFADWLGSSKVQEVFEINTSQCDCLFWYLPRFEYHMQLDLTLVEVLLQLENSLHPWFFLQSFV